MKKITLLLVFAMATLLSTAQVFVESFDYTTGTTLTSNGWTAHSAAGTNPITVGATSLTFPQYSPTGIGGSAVSAGNSEDANTYFTPINSGSVYASFLLRVDSIGTEGYFFHFMDSASTSAYRARTYFRQDASNANAFNLGLTFNSSTGVFDTTEFAYGSTILVVAKYTIVSGIDNDLVSLYAFTPAGSFTTEPAQALLGPVAGTAGDIEPARLALRQFNSGNGYAVDAFSVNTVWNMSPVFALAQIDLPINWEGTATDYTVTDFGGNASSVVVDPTNASNMVLKSDKTAGAQTWAGTTLSTPSGLATAIPFSAGNTMISVAVWSPDAGIQVRLKAEDQSNGAISVETEATTAVAGAWDTLVFDFANHASGTPAINFANTYNKLSIFYNFNVSPAATKTYYCDDVFFGGPTSNLTQIDLPIDWEGTTTDYTVTDFGGNASSVVVDPTNANNMVLKSDKTAGAQVWGGTTLSTPSGLASAVPFSAGNTVITAMVWSPDAGIQVRLKAEDKTNGAISVETEATTTMAGSWEMLTFDFANQVTGTPAINFANTYDKISIFYDFGTSPSATKTYYCDDIMFGVALNQVDLPITFDDATVDYDLVSFGNAIDSIVVDPTDPTNMVLRQDKPAGAQTWAGTVLGDGGLANVIPFTATHHFMTARVWSAAAGTPILMKVENVATGSISVETMATTTMAGAWETLTFDFTANQPGTPAIDYGQTYGKVVIFGDFGNPASGKTFYFDDIEFSASGVGVEENQWMNDFTVVPNPNNGNFTINGSLLGVNEVEITVIDIQGRTIFSSTERTSALNKELNLEGISSGMYILRVSSSNGIVTDKMMVRR
jgi:hypothetical protein